MASTSGYQEGVLSVDADVALMLQARDGAVECFDTLLSRYRIPVVHFLYRMVNNEAIAEELAQDAFLRVYRSRLGYEPTAKFSTWLFTIAHNLAANWLRDHRNERIRVDDNVASRRLLVDRQPTIDRVLLRNARNQEIRRAIAALSERQRAAVIMHKYHDMEYVQIARVLDCSTLAVKSLLFRAYDVLRMRLAHLR